MEQNPSLNDPIGADLLTTLEALRQQVHAAYPPNPLPPADPSLQPAYALPERWWVVQEHTFTSTIPWIGPLVAGFRSLWHSISTKWAIRVILHQQNEVNRILVEHLEAQSQTLRDLDHDQTHLTRQLFEMAYRLEKIEARLVALEQSR
ncbi:MAG: hypothetical protein HYR94_20250 [Chloroflexi bacterium]|nr:hypothetical protein [Chloroflexota bacterium]